jgi:cobalt-precorrin 5A hydrolase/precorrin-3B C17-methyltransferase
VKIAKSEMAAPVGPAPVLLVADDAGLPSASRLLDACPELIAVPHAGGVLGAGLSTALIEQYRAGHACVALADTETVIRALAPVLAHQRSPAGPAVIAVAPAGTAVAPLLGDGAALGARLAAALGIGLAGAAADPEPAGGDAPRGRLTVVGLGPGTRALRAPAVQQALDQAEDIVGYLTYLNMAGPFRPEQHLHGSDNRRELDRARLALRLAAEGRRVVVVSSGDPGVFGMATAVLEALDEAAGPAWAGVEIEVLPGISAAQAAAARVGAPLGHDFCVLSLSDNLKPWRQIAERLRLAARADLVIALYNPRSRARPTQLAEALVVLRAERPPSTPVVIARDVGRPDEQVRVTTLADVDPEAVDMRTLVIIGSSLTRCVHGGGLARVYTPRWYPPDAGPTSAPSDGAASS